MREHELRPRFSPRFGLYFLACVNAVKCVLCEIRFSLELAKVKLDWDRSCAGKVLLRFSFDYSFLFVKDIKVFLKVL